MNDFERAIHEFTAEGLTARSLDTLQINLGRVCNLACRHCHLECSPARRELMPDAVMEKLISFTAGCGPLSFDITGGAPELHPRLRYLIKALRAQGHAVQVRTNLTTLLDSPQKDLIGMFSANGVSLAASLPCYLSENVDAQRGVGVHARSIAALRLLNRAGYGLDGGPTLNLVYNPGGPFLPPEQATLEETYRGELKSRYGISFHRLLVLTNMPIGRFRRVLAEETQLHDYLLLLRKAFNPATIPHLMCRRQISIDWDGTLYDCDFNLALGLAANHGAPSRLDEFDQTRLARRRITTGDHCFGCTAGVGSSCAGSFAEAAS